MGNHGPFEHTRLRAIRNLFDTPHTKHSLLYAPQTECEAEEAYQEMLSEAILWLIGSYPGIRMPLVQRGARLTLPVQ